MTKYRTRFSARNQVADPDLVVTAEPAEKDGIQYMLVHYPGDTVVEMDDGTVFPDAQDCPLRLDHFNERYETVPEPKKDYPHVCPTACPTCGRCPVCGHVPDPNPPDYPCTPYIQPHVVPDTTQWFPFRTTTTNQLLDAAIEHQETGPCDDIQGWASHLANDVKDADD